MNQELRVGIVGANPERGWAKDAHIPALKHLGMTRITAVSARTREIATAAAAAFGAAAAFEDSLELVNSSEVDIVTVAVKVPEHRAVVLSALAAGKHVYCEWPLGRNLAEAQEMASAANGAGVRTAIGLQGTVTPAVAKAASLVKSGALGELKTMRVYSPTAGWGAKMPEFYAYLNDERNGATLATIAGGHTLAAVCSLAGEFSQIRAHATTRNPQVEVMGTGAQIERTCADHIAISGIHESGCASEIELVGGASPKADFLLELRGNRGELRLGCAFPGGYQAGNIELWLNGGAVPLEHAFAGRLIGPPANVAELYLRFINDILNGTQTAPDFNDALELTRLLYSAELVPREGQALPGSSL